MAAGGYKRGVVYSFYVHRGRSRERERVCFENCEDLSGRPATLCLCDMSNNTIACMKLEKRRKRKVTFPQMD